MYYRRSETRKINIGSVPMGGGSPISVQSMTNTDTRDIEATVRQILRLEEAGCDIVRVAVPDAEAASAVRAIKKAIHIPLVADIHFDYRLALTCLENGRTKFESIPGILAPEKKQRLLCVPQRNATCRSASV